jgi:hypothetical protein
MSTVKILGLHKRQGISCGADCYLLKMGFAARGDFVVTEVQC